MERTFGKGSRRGDVDVLIIRRRFSFFEREGRWTRGYFNSENR